LNYCKILESMGIQDNLFTRVMKQGYPETNVTCPVKKGDLINTYNHTFEDTFLPPLREEILTRVHKDLFGKLKANKKWTKLHTFDLYMRIKK
jgi:hypothetical protein